MNNYTDETMPVIILLLQSVNKKEAEIMNKKINEIFKDRKIDFIRVLAKKMEIDDQLSVSPFGLKELIEKTLEKFKNSINSMSFIYVQRKVEKSVEKEINSLVNKNNFSNISQSILDYFSKLMDFLDDNTKIMINTSVNNILLSCKSEIDYSDEINQNVSKFKQKYKYHFSLEEINEMSKRVESELEIIYNKIKTEYYKQYIPSEILKHYIDLVYNLSKSIINDNLKNIKSELIEKMKNGIENSPNFKKIFQLNLGK